MKKTGNKKVKIELLAPAGSLEKMRYAFHYGADAVYAGIPETSMRVRINDFTSENLAAAIEEAHALGKKFYVTLNIYAHNWHLEIIQKHLKTLVKVQPDAVIISDPGVIALVKKHLPQMEIHLSTQANALNWLACKFWWELGVKRIVLAREVTLEEIREIKRKVPKLELEYFVHGAMCMSYSGRCLLSKWMLNRSANLGDCAQPCRWAYQATDNPPASTNASLGGQLITDNKEDKQLEVTDIQGQHTLELHEDRHGTYFFNSRDLNLLAYLQDLLEAGVDSLKIEGRNKSVSYVSTVVRAYRIVLDAIGRKISVSELKKLVRQQQKELNKNMHRGYTAGFLLGGEPEHTFEASHLEPAWQFVGEVRAQKPGWIQIKAHNAIKRGEVLEVVLPRENAKLKVSKILNENEEETEAAHGGHEKLFWLKTGKAIPVRALLRKQIIKK